MIFVLFDTPSTDSRAPKAENHVWIDVTQVEAVKASRTYVDGAVSICSSICTKSGGGYTVAMDPADVLKKVADLVNDHQHYEEKVRSVEL